MRHAPLSGGEVPADADFFPPLPLPKDRESWLVTCRAALRFWQRAAADQRIGKRFRETCQANKLSLAILAERV